MEKLLKSEPKFKGRLLGLRVDLVRTENGVETTREVVEHPGAVAVVAQTKEGKILLVRQYRQPAGQDLLEVPAGVPKSGESGEETAARELEEETGYRADKVVKLWEGYASPGYSTEMIGFYFATSLQEGKTAPDEDEELEVFSLSLAECHKLISNGGIRDIKTVAAISLAEKLISSASGASE